MTGLHGLHVLVGIIVLLIMFFFIAKRPFRREHWDVFRMESLQGSSLSLTNSEGKSIWKSEAVDPSVKYIEVKFQYYPTPEKFHTEDFVALENSGLYWHLVDIIWIFIFPLLYLIG
jgi:heme/copper-type cytochrome/quinol oxidase subunit 3